MGSGWRLSYSRLYYVGERSLMRVHEVRPLPGS